MVFLARIVLSHVKNQPPCNIVKQMDTHGLCALGHNFGP